MVLTNLKLANFRNYNVLDIKFSPFYNIIYGNNGEGKTNIVEAIYLLSLSKSFRVNSDKLMIMKGMSEAICECKIKTLINTRYKVTLNNDSKIFEIDNLKQDKVSDYISNINVILFNPDDVNLIKDSPSERRKLINIEISKINREYLLLLTKYNKILKMRNAYLKIINPSHQDSKVYLDVLTSNLVDCGIKICKIREDFTCLINKFIGDKYSKIFGSGNLHVNYVSTFKSKNKEDIIINYDKYFSKEVTEKKTSFGIHHDDLVFILDGNKLKDYGSVGQHKNSILSFKLAIIEIIKEMDYEKPILILDDLFSELDNDKISNLLRLLDGDIQTFITTTNIELFNIQNIKNYKLFHVENGNVKEDFNGE